MALPMIPLVARGIASLAGRMATRNPQLGKNLLKLFNKPKGITRSSEIFFDIKINPAH